MLYRRWCERIRDVKKRMTKHETNECALMMCLAHVRTRKNARLCHAYEVCCLHSPSRARHSLMSVRWLFFLKKTNVQDSCKRVNGSERLYSPLSPSLLILPFFLLWLSFVISVWHFPRCFPSSSIPEIPTCWWIEFLIPVLLWGDSVQQFGQTADPSVDWYR